MVQDLALQNLTEDGFCSIPKFFLECVTLLQGLLVPIDAGDQLDDPLCKDSLCPEDEGFPAILTFLVHLKDNAEIPFYLVSTFSFTFVDHEEVPDFDDSGFDRLDVIAHPGNHHDHGGVGSMNNIYLVLAHANGLNKDDILPHGIHDMNDILGGTGKTS